MHAEDVILKPVITEKATRAKDVANRYGFVVNPKANKYRIKHAVEKLYGVKVLDVKTQIRPGKLKRVGRNVKKGAKTKRALVKLAEGQFIQFFAGV